MEFQRGSQITYTMENKKNDIVANATSGKASVKSFHYFNTLCFATLSNGVSGCVGDTHACSLRDMLALKGSGTLISYEPNGTYTDRSGQAQPKYRLEWSVE